MAQELRHETLYDTVADGTTTAQAGAEFRNDSSRTLSIRGLDLHAETRTAGPNEFSGAEIGKAPVSQKELNNSPFFNMSVTAETGTDVALDSSASKDKSRRWGRGQLTLEPNESLFLHTIKTSGGSSENRCDVEYEFM